MLDNEIVELLEKRDKLYAKCLEIMKSSKISDIQLDFMIRCADDDDDDCNVFYNYLLFSIMNNNKIQFFMVADALVVLIAEENYKSYIDKLECVFMRNDIKCEFMVDVAQFYDYLIDLVKSFDVFLELKKIQEEA